MSSTATTLTTTAPLIPTGGGEKAMCFGTEVTILLTGAQTGGAFSSYRVRAAQGAGAPPHRHDAEDESFTVLSGEFEIHLGDESFVVGRGGAVFLPRGVPHAFRCVSAEPGELYGLCMPAGHDAFFRDTNRYAEPPPLDEARALCRRHGIELLL